MTQVPGLKVTDNFLTEEEEAYFVEKIDECVWKDNRTKDRLVQVYGPYHDRHYKIIPGKFSAHPEWVTELAEKVKASTDDPQRHKLTDPKRCEVFVNEYKEDSSLQYHTDHVVTYDEHIYGVSLNCNSFMGFKKGYDLRKVPVKRRSLYDMAGDSRRIFKHGIDKGWIDGRRISVTFRTVRD